MAFGYNRPYRPHKRGENGNVLAGGERLRGRCNAPLLGTQIPITWRSKGNKNLAQVKLALFSISTLLAQEPAD